MKSGNRWNPGVDEITDDGPDLEGSSWQQAALDLPPAALDRFRRYFKVTAVPMCAACQTLAPEP
jgi:hypothetical protein